MNLYTSLLAISLPKNLNESKGLKWFLQLHLTPRIIILVLQLVTRAILLPNVKSGGQSGIPIGESMINLFDMLWIFQSV